MTNIKKSFCSVPFNEPYTNTFGAFGLCCIENESFNKNEKIFLNQDFDNHWNSDYLKSTRRSMLSGVLPPQCQVCIKHESVGKQSVRQRRNLRYFGEEEPTAENIKVKKLLDATDKDGNMSKDVKPEGVLFSTGRLCQLGCISCSSTYSTFLESEFDKIGWHDGFKDKKDPIDTSIKLGQTEINTHLYQYLKNNIEHINFMQVTGGEPLINKQFIEFLEWCVDNNYSKNIRLLITTNGMNIPKDKLGCLKKFSHVIISCSIDGYGKLDEYIRHPTIWDEKLKNIEWLKYEVDEFVVGSVVYSLNVLGLYELSTWLESNNIKHLFYPLEEPSFLHCKNMPQQLKQIAKDRVNKIYALSNINKDGVDSIINSLNKNMDHNDWKKITNQIETYKIFRNKDIVNYCPEFKDFV